MEVETIMLSEISHTEMDKYIMFTLICRVYTKKRMQMLTALVQPEIRRLPNSLCPVEESMTGHMGISRIY
jgi:hypothetical protein